MMNCWLPPAFRMPLEDLLQACQKSGVLFRDGANPEKSIQTLRFRNRVAANFASVARWAQGDGEQVRNGLRIRPNGTDEAF